MPEFMVKASGLPAPRAFAFGLPPTCRLSIAACRLPIAACRLPPADCRLSIAAAYFHSQ